MKDYLITFVIALLAVAAYNYAKTNVSALNTLP